MLLYFLRHAEAEGFAGSDFERSLTAKGLAQGDKAGKFCVRNGLLPEAILSSPLTRARQTAELVAKRLDGCEIIVCPWLACGMTPEDCLSELRAYGKLDQVMLVGHEPDMGLAIASLLGIAPDALHIRKASMTCVEASAISSGAGHLGFFVPSRLM